MASIIEVKPEPQFADEAHDFDLLEKVETRIPRAYDGIVGLKICIEFNNKAKETPYGNRLRWYETNLCASVMELFEEEYFTLALGQERMELSKANILAMRANQKGTYGNNEMILLFPRFELIGANFPVFVIRPRIKEQYKECIKKITGQITGRFLKRDLVSQNMLTFKGESYITTTMEPDKPLQMQFGNSVVSQIAIYSSKEVENIKLTLGNGNLRVIDQTGALNILTSLVEGKEVLSHIVGNVRHHIYNLYLPSPIVMPAGLGATLEATQCDKERTEQMTVMITTSKEVLAKGHEQF